VEEQNNLTRDEARARASLVSEAVYRVSLDLTGDGTTFGSDTVLTFRAEPGQSTFLDLIADSVETVELNGRWLGRDAFDGVRVHLAGLEAQNEVRVVARCRFSHTGAGLHRFVDPVDDRVYTYTDYEPFDAHRVFACFDQPDVKAAFTFEVLAPADWEVLSNMGAGGPPKEEGAARRWTFRPTPPISTYVTAVVAGPYHGVQDTTGDVPLGLYCRQSLAQYLEPEELFDISKQGFEFFERAFSYPYPFDKYDQVMVPEFNSGAMENAGCITFNEAYVFRSKVTDAARERRAETVLHEMAHMWFGDLVTMRWWDDLWLNETFATFASVLCMVNGTRFTNAWTTFCNSEKTWAYQQDQLPSTHPITADMPDTESIHTNFDGITYAKGASVIRQLVAWVGEDEFLRGIGAYFRRHEWGNTDLSDFLSALEETSGRDLHAWAKEWLQTAGVNVLRAEFETQGRGGDEVFTSIAIAQEAPPEWPVLRPHRLAVGLYGRDGEGLIRQHRTELDVLGMRTEVSDLVGLPVPDLTLINDDDLTYARIRLDPRSLNTVTGELSSVQDSLARALCWAACWDMVRDAEMPTREFLRLVLGNVRAESDIGMVQRILGQTGWAIDVYGDPANARSAGAAFASAALEILEGTEPGSDFQLAWARAFAGAARSEDHVAVVRGLLEGSKVFEGLDIDTELRWHLVASLASAGVPDAAELVNAEMERDPTDQGRRHGASALAARPLPEAKQEAWDRVTGDASLTTAMEGALMQGFQQSDQSGLLRPYVERYFDDIPTIWKDRSLEFALAFARGMYPGFVIEQEVADTTDRFLEERPPAGPVRRVMIEGRDGVLRALRARACDRDAAGP
jgi:aminopeptidase N